MYTFIAKAIMISRAKFHCNRLTTVDDIQDCTSLIFLHTVLSKFATTLLQNCPPLLMAVLTLPYKTKHKSICY